MGIPPGDLLEMSLHDYQAVAFHWSHQGEDDEPSALSVGDFDDMIDALHSKAMH